MAPSFSTRTFLASLTLCGLWVGSYIGAFGASTDAQKAVPRILKANSSKSAKPGSKSSSKPVAAKAGKSASTTHKAGVPDQSNPDFKLNATKTDSHSSDSGTFGALGAGDVAPAPVTFDRKFDMLVTPKPKEETPQVDVASAKKAAVDKTQALQDAEASKVDWTGWAGQFADRWFGNLKNLEYSSHRGWTTDRPAMIQFTCHADGRITNIQLRQSCGNPPYDNMQIEALKRTIPCPSFPSGTHLTSYTLIQGWEAHPRHPGDSDYKPGTFGQHMPAEKVPVKKPVAN